MFRKILFATSGSPSNDNAARLAFDLADRNHAELVLLHVAGCPTRGFSPYVVDSRTGEEVACDPDYLAWVREELETTYARQLEKAGDCGIEVRPGVPCIEILRTARAGNFDLIVLGAHARLEEPWGPGFRALAGNTMRRVAQMARCPVLIVNQPCDICFRRFSSIVFSTDFSRSAESAFAFAWRTAREAGCRLYLFHAVKPDVVRGGEASDPKPSESRIAAAVERIRSRYVARMEGFDNFEVEVREGIPCAEILKFTRERNADLLVMAHHGRGLEEAETESTVEEVALRCACPVASVNHLDKVEFPTCPA